MSMSKLAASFLLSMRDFQFWKLRVMTISRLSDSRLSRKQMEKSEKVGKLTSLHTTYNCHHDLISLRMTGKCLRWDNSASWGFYLSAQSHIRVHRSRLSFPGCILRADHVPTQGRCRTSSKRAICEWKMIFYKLFQISIMITCSKRQLHYMDWS